MADLNDIDLDLSPEEELRRLESEYDDDSGESDTSGSTERAETGNDTGDDDTGAEREEIRSEGQSEEEGSSEVDQAGEEEKPEITSEAEDKGKPKVEKETVSTEQQQIAALLAELQEEKKRLHDQLTELEVRSKIEKERAEVSSKEEEVEPPTPEEILTYVDGQIKAVEDQLAQAEAEDPAQAPALRRQLRQLERYYNDFSVQTKLQSNAPPDPQELAAKITEETQYKSRFDATRDAIVNEYPVLDKGSEYFNEELRTAVMDVYQPMIQAGKDPTESLVKATMLVMRSAGVPSVSEYRQQYEAQQKAEQEKAAQPTKTEKTTSRKEEAVQRNLKAAKSTPPNISEVGVANDKGNILDKYDFEKMSLNDFMKLTPEQEDQIEKALLMYDDS